ncbi:MAG TPA: nucleoside triphosphate pyrophosphatase [Steroidobacteraceae bacterium]|nr:nucleoside triphosphate pyrophosphatase [Steroidobacteraceae bacterium]
MAATLILASTSRYRAELLGRLGLAFEAIAPGVDESVISGEAPRLRAGRLAAAKAAAVASRHPGLWIIGSDQVADLEGGILDKPGDAARCRAQLASQSGRSVEFHTAVTLLRREPHQAFEHVDRTVVTFRHLDGDEIARYVERDRPFDCAGGFRSEGLGAALFESVETRDPSALVGLPLIWLAGALRRAGLDPLAIQS